MMTNLWRCGTCGGNRYSCPDQRPIYRLVGVARLAQQVYVRRELAEAKASLDRATRRAS